MSPSKIQAFKDQVNSGQLQNNKVKIYNLIKEQPSTIARLRDITNIPHQTLTGALSGLEELGWVYGVSNLIVNKRSYTLYAAETDIEKAKNNAMTVNKKKFLDWMYRGEKNGWFDEYVLHLELRETWLLRAIQNEQTKKSTGER